MTISEKLSFEENSKTQLCPSLKERLIPPCFSLPINPSLISKSESQQLDPHFKTMERPSKKQKIKWVCHIIFIQDDASSSFLKADFLTFKAGQLPRML